MSFARRGMQARTRSIRKNPRSSLWIVGLIGLLVVAAILISGALTNWWGLASDDDAQDTTPTRADNAQIKSLCDQSDSFFKDNKAKCDACVTEGKSTEADVRSCIEKKLAVPAGEPDDGPKSDEASVPEVGDKVYIKASDKDLFVHTKGGSLYLKENTLHPCPADKDYPNCQWVFERDDNNFLYLKSSDASLYLHVYGGSELGNKMTLHTCEKDKMYPNCRWLLEESETKPGHYYIRSSGGGYLHTNGGSIEGARLTLHPCDKDSDFPNCQWKLIKASER